VKPNPQPPIPAKLILQVFQLRQWVNSPAFGKGRKDRINALVEVEDLRGDLLWLKARRALARRDEAHHRDAVEWVRADAAETEAELLETIARLVPRVKMANGKWETGREYYGRLHRVRDYLTAGIPKVKQTVNP